MRTSYVKLLTVGLGDSVIPVSDRDPVKVPTPPDVDRCYGFKFFDMLSITLDIDGKSVEFKSGPVNYSCTFFFKGMLFIPKEDSLIKYMERHGADALLETQWGYPIPFKRGDVLLRRR